MIIDVGSLTFPDLASPPASTPIGASGAKYTDGFFSATLTAADFAGGTWQGKTFTLANSLITSGNFSLTLTQTNTTTVTLPTTGTLATLAGVEALSNKTGNISQWTNDSGYLTSVTAHNVLSATHGDTLADTVVRGDILYGNATPKWARLPKPSVLSGLSHDGTDVSWVTATGTGAPVRAAGATLSTPTLGVAVATSLNGNTFTTGTYTLTGAASKTLTFNNTLTLAGADATTMTFPSTSATIARTDTAQTFTGSQTIAALVGPVTITEAVGSSGLTITGATQTSSFPALNLTQAWNNSGTAFTLIKGNVTNTASDASSKFFDFQVAGVSTVWVTRFGMTTPGINAGSTTQTWFSAGSSATSLGSNITFGWSNSTNASGSIDLILSRATASALQLGADVNGAAIAQTLQAANGITGTDKAGADFTIQAGKGTGAATVSSLIFKTPAVGSTGTTAQTSTTRLTITEGSITIADATNLVVNATTGTKIGTATTQKLGFYNATPIVQGASVADASGGAIIDAEARTAINALISRIEATGLIATV